MQFYLLDSGFKLPPNSDNFIRWIGHFYPMDNVIQASYNAIFTLDKIYPTDSEFSAE